MKETDEYRQLQADVLNVMAMKLSTRTGILAVHQLNKTKDAMYSVDGWLVDESGTVVGAVEVKGTSKSSSEADYFEIGLYKLQRLLATKALINGPVYVVFYHVPSAREGVIRAMYADISAVMHLRQVVWGGRSDRGDECEPMVRFPRSEFAGVTS